MRLHWVRASTASRTASASNFRTHMALLAQWYYKLSAGLCSSAALAFACYQVVCSLNCCRFWGGMYQSTGLPHTSNACPLESIEPNLSDRPVSLAISPTVICRYTATCRTTPHQSTRWQISALCDTVNGDIIERSLESQQDLRLCNLKAESALAFLMILISIYSHWGSLILTGFVSAQRYIIRIIFMVPLYAVMSLLSLLMPNNSIYFDSVRDW